MNWKLGKTADSKKPKKKKSKTREWVDALIFAVIAATIIRTFVLEAYTIPTPSMEKSLLVGDFLFVSKMHFGNTAFISLCPPHDAAHRWQVLPGMDQTPLLPVTRFPEREKQ